MRGGAFLAAAMAVVLTTGVAVAAPALPSYRKGDRYDALRARLITAGYQPRQVRHTEQDIFCWEGFCRKYPEALDCAGTGIAPCIMLFRNARTGKNLTVYTWGEEKLRVTSVVWTPKHELKDLADRQSGRPR